MPTYHIITIGCQMNKSDSERVASVLEQNGYKKSDNKNRSDLVVVNTCGVRQAAEDRIYGLIPEIKRKSASRRKKVKIILTGCLVERADVRRRLKNYVDFWLPIYKITNYEFPWSSQDKRITNEISKKNINCYNDNYLKIQPKYESKFSAFLPIGNGCDNFCSYCVVPYARGREVYRPLKDILAEVKTLVKKNYKEIILIAQNVNSYKSGKTDFADLLKQADNINGDFWIRFLTSHPKDMSAKLIKVIADSKKVCRHIHLPVQAGDDKILKAMNRKYSIKHYVNLIKKIRKAISGVSITTDIIVGFPGQTKKEFNNSVRLIKKIKFDLVYVVRYSPRPGTVAFKLVDDVSKVEKKRREEKLMQTLKEVVIKNNKKYLGKTLKVLVEGINKKNELFGSTETAKTVRILAKDLNQRLPRSLALPRNDKLIGEFVLVKINKLRALGLDGEIVH